jgi:hypothetical protein
MGLLNILSFKIGYLCAVRGYLKAAMKKGRPAWQQADYNEPNEEELTNAGKGVKGYLKDLWSSFILVVSPRKPSVAAPSLHHPNLVRRGAALQQQQQQLHAELRS